MIEVHKRIVGPKFRSKLFPSNQFPGAPEQHEQDLEGLFTHLHSEPKLPQLAGTQIDRIRTE
jgi:hypothetical protein